MLACAPIAKISVSPIRGCWSYRDEWGDGIQLQILTVFPGFVLQQIHNCLAVRQIVPRGVDAMDLHWTYLGFADDTPDMRALRLKQCNLVGPAGFVSMEDGCVGGFVQRGTVDRGGRGIGGGNGRHRRRDSDHPRHRDRRSRLLERMARPDGGLTR